MRFIRDSSEEEMILAFLAAEVDSPRFGGWARPALGEANLIRNPDLLDPGENARRRKALAAYRGYGTDKLLFEGFPAVVAWKLVEVSVDELGEFHYARVTPWTTLSKGSLLVRDGAANVETVPAENANTAILAVERAIAGGRVLPPLIAASEGMDSPHFLLEGHTRASAYVRALTASQVVQVIVGYVSDLSGWRWH